MQSTWIAAGSRPAVTTPRWLSGQGLREFRLFGNLDCGDQFSKGKKNLHFTGFLNCKGSVSPWFSLKKSVLKLLLHSQYANTSGVRLRCSVMSGLCEYNPAHVTWYVSFPSLHSGQVRVEKVTAQTPKNMSVGLKLEQS